MTIENSMDWQRRYALCQLEEARSAHLISHDEYLSLQKRIEDALPNARADFDTICTNILFPRRFSVGSKMLETDFRRWMSASLDRVSLLVAFEFPLLGIDLSIQASGSHYCQPRQSWLPITEYTGWEVAMLNDKDPATGRFVSFLNPHKDPRFSGLAVLERYDDGEVGGFVPTSAVQELYECLQQLELERM